MKNVGNITEARMARPAEPKHHPLVSDALFEGKVKLKGKVKKLLKQDVSDPDLPMNKTPEASKMTTNSPKRTTPKSTQVGGPYDVQEKKDDNWIQGAEKDIERRGTEGKCTPITKPGCTGRAKALAKTFKKMAKKRDDSIKAKNESIGSQSQKLADKTMSQDDQTAIAKKRAEWRSKLRPTGDDGKNESSTPKPIRQARARAQAGKPIKKGTAKMVASDPGQDLATAVKAGDKL